MAAIEPSSKRARSDGEAQLEELQKEFHNQGCVFPGKIFDDATLDNVDQLLTGLVEKRPQDLKPEDLMNLHMTHEEVLKICRHPSATRVAQALLGTEDVSIFTSRILCKMAGTGAEIPWHQDSNYWPLVPPGETELKPLVASLWLAVDAADQANGAMEVLSFDAQPETRHRNCTELLVDSGGDTQGFDNFNLSLAADKVNASAAKLCELKRGETEWHSSWTVHRSGPNKSDRRRLAWIVRYVPTGTTIRGGVRGAFDEEYPLVPAAGKGAEGPAPRAGEPTYQPCFGNKATMALLKK